MSSDSARWVSRRFRRLIIGALGVVCISGSVVAANVHADPADDALAKLNELSRQAEQTTEQMHTAQLDLDKKLAAQKAAEQKHDADVAAADDAKAALASYQTTVDKLAAAMYMGAHTDSLSAIMTADTPQHLIDQMSAQEAVARLWTGDHRRSLVFVQLLSQAHIVAQRRRGISTVKWMIRDDQNELGQRESRRAEGGSGFGNLPRSGLVQRPL